MSRYLRLGVGLGALIVVFVLVGAAQADIVVPSDFYQTKVGTTGSPPGNNPSWASNPIQQQDKLYTWSSNSPNLDGIDVSFTVIAAPSEDRHTVTLGGAQDPFPILATDATYTLDYSVDIVGGGPGIDFKDVTLGVNAPGATNVNVTKVVAFAGGNVTLESINGSDVGTGTFPAGTTHFDVSETIFIGANNSVVATSNQFRQNVVPEPASVTMLTVLAGIGIAVGLRRRKAG